MSETQMTEKKLTGPEMIDLCKRYTMWTWSKGGTVDPMAIERAEGVYIYTPEGRRILDFNSQLMSVNIGHGNARVREAIKRQVDDLLFITPAAATPVRARLGKKMAEILPGHLNTMFFTLGGAEANENAIRAARLYTGRFKILSRQRSYHGATNATMQLSGDPRRWANEPGAPGFIRVMHVDPYNFSFGSTDEEKVENYVKYLDETICYENPETIAAFFVEPITGTNGILAPPKGYFEAVKVVLDKYGILLVVDEVMAGFGRTGKWLSIEHTSVVPDIATMAKGLTSSYAPLGCMAVSDRIAQHFQDNMFWGGLTYNSHPLSLAAAEAVIDVMIEDKLLERSVRMGEVMRGHMQRMKDTHPSVKSFRQIALLGMIDIQKDADGTPAAPYNGTSEAMGAMAQYFRDNGLFTLLRWNGLMCNPPLTITEAQMADAFEIIDGALAITDAAMV